MLDVKIRLKLLESSLRYANEIFDGPVKAQTGIRDN